MEHARSPTGAQAPKLQLSRLRMEYAAADGGVFVALDELSLQAGADEFICLLGPSGCGKTTLLNLIAGFTEPSQGELRIDARQVRGPGADRGVVFQDYALFPWLTVRQNVEFGPRVKGLPAEEQHALAAKYLEMVGLTEFADRYPHQLSGGMKQRVAIARALANHPTMLLMDEPFGALDAMTRETMQDELRRLVELEPKLVIFVTHSVAEAVFLADRVVVMAARPGRVIADIKVNLPHPRDRTSQEVTNLVREMRPLLTQEEETK